jgi:uncharacterized protein YfiM (DUF2279 family)
MTGLAFANAVWTMTLGALGWIVFATVSADKMEKVQKKFFWERPQAYGRHRFRDHLAVFCLFSAGTSSP